MSSHDNFLTHLLEETRHFNASREFSAGSHLATNEEYKKLYHASIENNASYWLQQAATLDWAHFPTIACKYQWDSRKRIVEHSWFEDGLINVSYNCLDRHLAGKNRTKAALIWQGDDANERLFYSYEDLHRQVCRFANVLKGQGVCKGDRVCIYLPTIPQLAIAMLACARIGAIHSVVFGGFSSEALAHRIKDCGSKLLITADVSKRGGKQIYLKQIADEAVQNCPSIEKVIVVKRLPADCTWNDQRDLCYDALMSGAAVECAAEELAAEDPLFILYTSGSTGKPKGVVHTQAGYLLQACLTHKYLFDIHSDDVYWCTADLGWITGHSYVIYGPLANGTTTLMFEGIPTYPQPDRYWQVIEDFQVTKFYTAPTAIRALISLGEEWPKKHALTSLRLLGSVGEPINPEAWMWYYRHIGKKRCPIVDTWWQTETGGIMLSSFPGCHTLHPGSAGKPFFGVAPAVLRDDGSACAADEGGALCITKPWPGIMRTMWGDHEKFIDIYFKQYDNVYFSGDGCRIDEEGDYWLLGRIDDVVNISGHRIGTAEVESALVSHHDVAEAAVVPVDDEIRGQGLHAYIILKAGKKGSGSLEEALKLHVRKEIGAIAVPKFITVVNALPKTRSGKIMRRILKQIAAGETENLGDISTLADPSVIEQLKKLRR